MDGGNDVEVVDVAERGSLLKKVVWGLIVDSCDQVLLRSNWSSTDMPSRV